MDSHEPVSTHEDETGDWLWDFEDRYNVASAEDLEATRPAAVVAATDTRVAEVRKHVRSRDGRDRGIAEATVPAAVASAPEPRHIPPPRPSQGPSHRAVFIAAAILVVLGVGGLAFALSRGSKHATPPSVALSTPTTPSTVVSGPFGVTTTQPPSPDTTPTTGSAFPSDTSTGAPPAPGNVTTTGDGTGGTGNRTGGVSQPTTGTTTPGHPATTPPPTTPPPTTPTTVPAATTVPTTPAVTTVPTVPPTAPPTTVPTVTTTPSTGTTVITVPFP